MRSLPIWYAGMPHGSDAYHPHSRSTSRRSNQVAPGTVTWRLRSMSERSASELFVAAFEYQMAQIAFQGTVERLSLSLCRCLEPAALKASSRTPVESTSGFNHQPALARETPLDPAGFLRNARDMTPSRPLKARWPRHAATPMARP
jgi:hypothetical protein